PRADAARFGLAAAAGRPWRTDARPARGRPAGRRTSTRATTRAAPERAGAGPSGYVHAAAPRGWDWLAAGRSARSPRRGRARLGARAAGGRVESLPRLGRRGDRRGGAASVADAPGAGPRGNGHRVWPGAGVRAPVSRPGARRSDPESARRAYTVLDAGRRAAHRRRSIDA